MTVRPDAAVAAEQLRQFIADPASAGVPASVHLSMSPRRNSCWLQSWNIGLFRRLRSPQTWQHALLPAWEYTTAEMRTEMVDDLEHLAATGEQPKEATR